MFALALALALGSPSGPVKPHAVAPATKVAVPQPSRGGAAAESTDDARTSAPEQLRTRVRLVLEQLDDVVGLDPKEQALLHQVVLGLRGGNSEAASLAWANLIEINVLRVGNTDIDGLVQYVIREAYLDADEDLRSIAEKIKAYNAAKRAIREHAAKIRAAAAKAATDGDLIPVEVVSVPPRPRPGKKAIIVGKTTKKTRAEWEAYAVELEQKLGPLDEMTEKLAIELQASLDQQAKAHASISALVKKYDETAKAIINNLKG